MAPRKRISKAARVGGLSLASLAAMVWVAMVANLSQLGPVGLDGQATIQLLGAFELIALFALLTALTILAAAAGEMTRGAKLAALVLLPLAFAACWRSLTPLASAPAAIWRGSIVAPALAPPLIGAYALTILFRPFRRAWPSRLAGSVAWGGVALICVAVLTLHLMREASARHEAEADHRWQAKFDATPANAPLAKWTEQLETAAPARRKDVLAAMRKVPTRQRDAETLLDGDAFPIGALGAIDLDPTQSLCEKARASLVRGAARLLPLAPGSREFREIADKFDAAADALEWLVANGCDCGDASRAWEAVARGYLDPNFDVARLKSLRDREAVERLRESNVKNFSLLTPRSSLQAWLRFADDRKFGVEALIGARSLEHRTGDAIEALSSEFDPDSAATVLRFLPTLDLDPTPALCRAALREVRRQLAAVSRPPLSGPRSYSALLEETAREQPLAALQWLAAHGCPAEAELADAQALVSAYQDSPSRAAMLASLAELRRKP